MDLDAFLILLIIFGLISFVIEKIWGLNPYKVYVAIASITVIFPILYSMMPIIANPSDINASTLSINRLITWLVNFLPGAIIGDIAGVVIAKITGEEYET